MKTGPKPKPAAERFWRLVEKRGPEECWPWLGHRHPGGHGQFNVGNKVLVYAHRFSFELHHGRSVAEGTQVLHRPVVCHNPSCVNPAHLYEGNDALNTQDRDTDGTLPKGIDHWHALLTEKDIPVICALYWWSGFKSWQIAEEYRVSRQCISSIAYRRTWRHVPVSATRPGTLSM